MLLLTFLFFFYRTLFLCSIHRHISDVGLQDSKCAFQEKVAVNISKNSAPIILLVQWPGCSLRAEPYHNPALFLQICVISQQALAGRASLYWHAHDYKRVEKVEGMSFPSKEKRLSQNRGCFSMFYFSF